MPVDKSKAFIIDTLKAETGFNSKEECLLYIDKLLPELYAKGYVTASIDSLQTDSTAAQLMLFVGEVYKWHSVSTDEDSRRWLEQVGWDETLFAQQNYNYELLNDFQQKMLQYFENNGYPFAKVLLDNLQISGNQVSGTMRVKPGPLYYVDSIRVIGSAKISNDYLQNFLDIKNGSVYSKQKLQKISTELKKLNYVEEKFPPQFVWRTTGGVVELFLDQQKSSQVNLIIGFLPNSNPVTPNKLVVTGEGLLNLKNALGSGETIGLVWQKLQAASQRLNINYQQPYLFKTPFGLDFGFNMLKRDSSFLNFDIRLGTQYQLNNQQYVRAFVQRFNSIISAVNTNQVIITRRLPEDADVRITNVGLEYGLNTTNYIFNPVKGFEINIHTAAGNKIIKPNNQILELRDDNDPDFNFASLYDTVKTRSYQLRTILSVAKYFPLGKAQRSTIKTAINGGYIGSSNIFRNELFQIGGYRLLRGFDEQSQYLSQYGIGTLEYRLLAGENSYFNVFSDGGWGKNASRGNNVSYTYLSFGLGLAFETKVGLFNLAWAVGKRSDTQFNLRQSKIHFGFVNYF